MSRLSDALAAMDKATSGPWDIGNGRKTDLYMGWDSIIAKHEDGDRFVLAQVNHNYEELAKYNAPVIAAAPDALAWIKEALPYITSSRDALATNLENCDLGPREEGAARKELARLDALIARAKPEGVWK